MNSEIKKIHHDLVSGACSCYEIVSDKISLLKKTNRTTVNLLLDDYALALAKQKDGKMNAGEPLGLLEGIPFGIQDVLMLQNTFTTGGSDFLRNYVSPYTATTVQRLLEAGAIPVVKENCDSFGHGNENTVLGAVGNTRDTGKVAGVAGGGGSAVNVAKGYTVFSIGDDSGGSIRQPAGYNRIYGLKPTFGRVSRYGSMNPSSTGCIGPFTTSLEDIRIIMNAISGKDTKDNTTFSSELIPETVFQPDYPNKNITIGYYPSFLENDYLDTVVKNDFQKMIDRLSTKGLIIKSLPFFDVNILVSTFYVLTMAETASGLAKLDGSVYGRRGALHTLANYKDGYMTTRSENFTEETKRRIIAGNQLLSQGHCKDIYLKAQMLSNSIKQKLHESFEQVDIILSPVSTALPPELGSRSNLPHSYITDNPHSKQNQIEPNQIPYMQDAFTVGFSLGGFPALTVPFFTPTGIQISANKNKEDLILHFAQSLKDKQQ